MLLDQMRDNQELTLAEKFDIVRVYYGLLRDNLVTSAQKTTARLLGRSCKTASKVLNDWNKPNNESS